MANNEYGKYTTSVKPNSPGYTPDAKSDDNKQAPTKVGANNPDKQSQTKASEGYGANANKTENKQAQPMDSKDSKSMLDAEIKKTWNKLSDDDIQLYETQPAQFFDKLKTKHGVTREDANKTLRELKVSCGCDSSKAA